MRIIVRWIDGHEPRSVEVEPRTEVQYYPNSVIFVEKGSRAQYKINRNYFISEVCIND